jgi:WD40 repeat protein
MKKQKFELSHDIIAEKIWERLPEQDKQLRQIKLSITHRLEDFQKGRGSLLGKKELATWKVYLPMLHLTAEEQHFVLRSEQDLAAAQKAEQDRIEQEKRQIKRNKRLQAGVAIVLFLASLVSGYFIDEAIDKTAAAKIADTKMQIAVEKTTKLEQQALQKEDELNAKENELKQYELSLIAVNEAKSVLDRQINVALNKLRQKEQNLEEANLSLQAAKSQKAMAEASLEATQLRIGNLESLNEIAVEEKENALIQAQIASDSKQKALRLLKLNFARSLAVKTQAIPKDRAADKALLAVAASDIHYANEGQPLEADIFSALYYGFKDNLSDLEATSFNALSSKEPGPIRAIQITPDGKNIFSTGSYGTLYQWNLKSWNHARKPSLQSPALNKYPYKQPHHAIAYHPNNPHLILAGSFPYLKKLNLEDNTTDTINLHAGRASRQLAYISQNELASLGEDGAIVFYKLEDKTRTVLASTNRLSRVFAVAEQGRYICFFDSQYDLKIYDTVDEAYDFQGSLEAGIPLMKQGIAITSMALKTIPQPGASPLFTVVIGYENGSITLFNLEQNAVLDNTRQLDFHRTRINALQFSPDGSQLFVSSYDNMVSVWNENAELSLVFDDHGSWATSLAYYEGANQLIVGYYDGQIRFYNLSPAVYMDELCRIIQEKGLQLKEANIAYYHLEDYISQISLCDK